MKKTNRTAVVIAVMLTNFLAAVDVTIVGTAMSTIIGQLGGLPLMSWVFSAYLLSSTVSTPIYGKLSDLYGRKVIYNVGTIIFLIGSVLAGLSASMVQLILFRTIQGLGAGAILSIAMTIIGDIFTLEERGRVQGWFSGVWGISSIIGPALGGFIVDYFSWPWVFYINVPFGILAILLLGFALHENIEKRRHAIDYLGAVMLSVSMTALLLGLLQGQEHKWTSVYIIALFVIAVVAFAVFLFIETRVEEPIVPLDLFRHSVISISTVVSFMIGAVLMGVTSYIPIYVQGVLGDSATQAGSTLTPMSIGWMIGSIFGGRRLVKWGFRTLGLYGVFAIALGACLLTGFSQATGRYYAMLSLLVMGIGFGFSTLSLVVAVQSVVEWNRRGISTATNQFVRTLGSSIGVAVMGALLNYRIVAMLRGKPLADSDPLQVTNVLLEPARRAALPPAFRDTLIHALSSGLFLVFVAIAVCAVIACITMLFFPRNVQEGHVLKKANDEM
ncbi:MFS transporter [Collibacillus ludicampi]|uniref:MFS transporter n=1 Tax=Collibacillus ludicampi TaxID=2771369 RepID=A0AAV4LKG2_9BACL|nr:MDR family MFS transporter [Collibacillus ludicampi]GIM48273.1 MFS transporter [Collibacillus ludicampi]